MSAAYFNELDPQKAEWIRELMKVGVIAEGEVDERSIRDVQPEDVRGFTQCHFFAGIAVWSYALRAAGWPDDSPVWTGSCPCQSFSASGKRGGFSDQRHLWPAWFRLIQECKPGVVFGEQVSSKDGLAWFDIVASDMENEDYAIGALDICAAGVGAPHIRQRLYFVADAASVRQPTVREIGSSLSEGNGRSSSGRAQWRTTRESAGNCEAGLVADTELAGLRGRRASETSDESGTVERPERLRATGSMDDSTGPRCDGAGQGPEAEARDEARMRGPERGRAIGELGHAEGRGLGMRGSAPGSGGRIAQSGESGILGHAVRERRQQVSGSASADETADGRTRRDAREPNGDYVITGPGEVNGFWSSAEWLPCRDGKYRPVEPGTFPLAHGVAARVLRLRGYGDAIVAEQAKAFIESHIGTSERSERG